KNGLMFPTSVCDGKDGGLFPMYGSCQGYYICNNGMAIVGTCDEKSRFDPTSLRCDDANKVECVYAESGDADEDNDEDDDDDEDDENMLDSDSVEIIETTTTTRRPPPKQQKPITPLVPIIKPNKDFEQTSATDRLCLGKKNGLSLVKEGSCTEFYVCKAKRPHLRQCPVDQHFSPFRHICMNPEDAKCAFNEELVHHDTPAITAGLCSESKQDSLVPHREDCGKFMLCSNMMFLVMDCPVGLHFDAEAKRCDYPKVAQCEAQKAQKTKTKTKKSEKKGLSKRK
ncbi:hypothetical protein KR044_006995, partial [Drosophila immigrans]